MIYFYREDRDGKEQVGFGFQRCHLSDCISCHGFRIVLLLWPCHYSRQQVRNLLVYSSF